MAIVEANSAFDVENVVVSLFKIRKNSPILPQSNNANASALWSVELTLVHSTALKMYLNGIGLRGIERVTEIHHTTIMNWIKDGGLELPDTPEESEIPEITEIEELQTFVGNKKNKVWLGSVVNHWKPDILLWTLLRSQQLQF